MKRPQNLMKLFIGLLLSGSLWAQPGNPDSLKLAHTALAAAFQAGNFEALAPMIHRSSVGFFRESQQLARLTSTFGAREVLTPLWVDAQGFINNPYMTDFTVAGDTGIVSVTAQLLPVRDGKKNDRPRYSRATLVYTRQDGSWKLCSWHISDTPLKQQ